MSDHLGDISHNLRELVVLLHGQDERRDRRTRHLIRSIDENTHGLRAITTAIHATDHPKPTVVGFRRRIRYLLTGRY